MKQLFLERWQKFDQKEQSFLAVCGLLLSGFLLYAFLWLPIQQANQRLTNELPKKEAQYILMKLQAAEIEKKRNQFHLSKVSKAGLRASIERSAKDQGIVLEKLSDQAEVSGNGLHVQIATIAFDVWIKWAESLQANQGIRVVSCQISPNIKAGEVRVDAVLGAQN